MIDVAAHDIRIHLEEPPKTPVAVKARKNSRQRVPRERSASVSGAPGPRRREIAAERRRLALMPQAVVGEL